MKERPNSAENSDFSKKLVKELAKKGFVCFHSYSTRVGSWASAGVRKSLLDGMKISAG